jgi:dihydroorotate dehydrogenase electron transfer subunit
MPIDHNVRVHSNEPLAGAYHLLSLELPRHPPEWHPGQFVMISTGLGHDPLLRRPYSIYNLYDPEKPMAPLQILYKIYGRGSAVLGAARPGDRLSCLFPLGRGFAPEIKPGQQLALVAGGAGVASLHPLAAAELNAGRKPLLLFGARNTEEAEAGSPTTALGVETRISTDDGSTGRRGFVSDLLEEMLAERGADNFVVCACGPTPMMKATAEVAHRHGVTCYLALESTMACGYGVCVGCVIGVRVPGQEKPIYKKTCIDGPVMNAADVIW